MLSRWRLSPNPIGYTSSDMVKNGIKGLGYRTKREKDYLLD
jgi:hypothetical protein